MKQTLYDPGKVHATEANLSGVQIGDSPYLYHAISIYLSIHGDSSFSALFKPYSSLLSLAQ
jgi:hypothetical protein